MKKSRRVKFILIIGIFVLIIIGILCFNNITYFALREYRYTDNGYAIGSIMKIEEVIFEEIDEEAFNNIEKMWPFNEDYGVIGRIDYKHTNAVWNYSIYGNRDVETRILIVGKEAYAFNDANLPEVYFCRQDILQLFEDMNEE